MIQQCCLCGSGVSHLMLRMNKYVCADARPCLDRASQRPTDGPPARPGCMWPKCPQFADAWRTLKPTEDGSHDLTSWTVCAGHDAFGAKIGMWNRSEGNLLAKQDVLSEPVPVTTAKNDSWLEEVAKEVDEARKGTATCEVCGTYVHRESVVHDGMDGRDPVYMCQSCIVLQVRERDRTNREALDKERESWAAGSAKVMHERDAQVRIGAELMAENDKLVAENRACRAEMGKLVHLQPLITYVERIRVGIGSEWKPEIREAIEKLRKIAADMKEKT